MKPNIVSEYHVFLASPGDMDAERREVRKFFEDYNRHTAARWGLRFTVVDWENYSTFGIGRPQELITQQTLEKFQDSLALVIGLMGQRFGSPTGAHESGTEEEFDWALTAYLQTGFPEVKWFFRNIETFQSPPDPQKIADALNQWTKVRAFRERLETSTPPLYYGTFSDLAHFREVFRNDLSLWLNDEGRAWHAQHEHAPVIASDVVELPAVYFKSLAQEFESLDIAGIDNERAVDIPLDEVYVRLRVIRDEDSAGADEDLDGGPIDIHTALGQYDRLVIVGDPGSGKSTFLKFIALMIARAKLQDEPGLAAVRLNLHPPLPVPFFVSLWDLSDFIKHSGQATENAISDFIVSRANEKGATLSHKTLEEMLAKGSCCLLFDGLDEVPTEQGRALISRLVEKFVGRFEKNRFVVTSRGRGYTGGAILKGGFVRCDVQNFDESDRREFLKNWFGALLGVSREHVLDDGTPSRAAYDALSPAIESKDRIRVLAVNPLMMTVIAIVHWNRKRLPDQRVDLYDECVDVLLGQRKAAERTVRYGAADVLNEETENEVQYDRAWTRKRFAEIALRILESGTDEITRDVVIGLLQQRFRDRLGATDERAANEAERFLDSQELRSGLLVSRRSHSCRFVHLTFQEYLAAWSLAPQNLNVIKTTIAPHLRDPQWFEPLQLLGGELARNSDEKLDEYVSYLLGTMGTTIAKQAPIIALCANILQDIKGVADIKPPTQDNYTKALKGTLHAFKPGSGVPTKTQLEVLYALIPLGASVKEHLIEATKSSYFPVRSQAINMLIPHISDNDLFSMDHIFEDRSQEPIIVYMSALFERDGKRAMTVIKKRDHLSNKAAKVLLSIFDKYLDDVDFGYVTALGKWFFDNTAEYDAIAIIRRFYNHDYLADRLNKILSFWVAEVENEAVRDMLFTSLVRRYTDYDSEDRRILSRDLHYPGYFLRNPLLPIDDKWVERCSIELNVSKDEVWERFERLAKVLPIKLER